MNVAFSPLSFSTAFSLALHAALAVAFLLTQPAVMRATGEGIEIELVSSSYLSEQQQTERAANKTAASARHVRAAAQQASHVMATAAISSVAQPPAVEQDPDDLPVYEAESIERDSDEGALTASTNASAHNRTIVELLHSSISKHKQYPYLAMRQRREGVVRVGFVLHPDGAIDETRLIQSSRTRILDKAALDAVKRIEPFKLAKDFLEKPEAFQVDVVFNVI